MLERNIVTSLATVELTDYLCSQLSVFFPDKGILKNDLLKIVFKSFQRTINCFSYIKGKHYNDAKHVYFNHLHGDQYCMFLYFSSREAYLDGNEDLYLKLSLLNKHLFAIDLFGHIEMPEIFLLVHPIGSIFGRAKYENYFVAYQGVTIGGIHNSSIIDYPSFGKSVACFANATVLGSSRLGDNVIVGANSTVINGLFDSDLTILGLHPNNIVKPTNRNVMDLFFLT